MQPAFSKQPSVDGFIVRLCRGQLGHACRRRRIPHDVGRGLHVVVAVSRQLHEEMNVGRREFAMPPVLRGTRPEVAEDARARTVAEVEWELLQDIVGYPERPQSVERHADVQESLSGRDVRAGRGDERQELAQEPSSVASRNLEQEISRERARIAFVHEPLDISQLDSDTGCC